jgi:hypothetical protein
MTQTAPAPICPYCGTEVEASQASICSDCQTNHHSECWAENGGCTTFGCKCAPADEEKIHVDASSILPLPQTDIHITLNGQLLGPLTLQEVRDKIQRGIFTALTPVWHASNPQWTELGVEMPQLFSPSPAIIPNQAFPNPFTVEEPAPGLGRLAFFGSLVGVVILAAICGAVTTPQSTNVVAAIGAIILMAFRAKNIGHSPWYCLFAFLPCANCIIYGYFLTVPPKYAITKKMDTAAYIILSLFGLSLALIVLLIALGK